MKKLIFILLLSSCVTPAPDKVEQVNNETIKKKVVTCPAGKLSYPNKDGIHQHAIQPGPNRAALIKCACENN